MKKNIFKLVFFIVLALSVCYCLVFGLQKKNEHIQELYSMKNCDVLLLGSSHAYVNLNGAVMYDNYGLASACIAQGEQQIRMSYYSLKSALRYCHPKVVVLETYMAVVDDDYGLLPTQYANALLSFPIYRNLDVRLEAAKDLKGTNYIDYISGIPIYHNDYKKWYPAAVVEHTAGYTNGSLDVNEEGLKQDRCSTDTVGNVGVIGKKTEWALRQTAKLCKDNEIELVFLITPYQASAEHMERLNAVSQIADELDIEFVDMNNEVDRIGINLDTDMYDWGHANKEGEEKNSIWFGKWLTERYKLADRRDDCDYAYWEMVSHERKTWEEQINK